MSRIGLFSLLILVGGTATAISCSGSETRSRQLRQDGQQAVERYLAQEAANLGVVDPPVVPIIRLITSDEWLDVMLGCLREAGIAAEVSLDGTGLSFSNESRGTQARNIPVAIYVCEATYPLAPEYIGPPSEVRLREQYRFYIEILLPCLAVEGVEIVEVPSEEDYVDSEGAWSPYAEVLEKLNGEQVVALMSVCPQVPG